MAGGGDGDLNLIPYLDIVVTLTTAFLVFTLEVTNLAQAPVDAPPLGPDGKGDASLAVGIGPDGFTLTSEGEAVTIPREGGAWPYARLTELLRDLRDAGDTTNSLRVAPAGEVPYKVLVATLDAARSDAQGPLYPGVSLAVAAR